MDVTLFSEWPSRGQSSLWKEGRVRAELHLLEQSWMYEYKCISEVVGDVHAVGPGGNEGVGEPACAGGHLPGS